MNVLSLSDERMAIYHLHAGFVSRSSGRTSVQSAAYICGEKLHEDHRDQDVDYTKRSHDVVCHNTISPDHSRYRDISIWNEIENFENRYAENYFKNEDTKNRYLESAQTAQTMVIALPNELSTEANKELIEQFVETRFTSRNLVSTYAIHKTDSNMHAHIQISRRAIGEDGEFINRKDREICSRSSLLETRKLWADLANEYLAKEGFRERITEKSLEDLGINLEATKHRGWYADSIGTDSRIAQENIDISRRNEDKILSDPNILLDYLNEKQAVFTQKDILREIGKRVFEDKKISAVFEKVLEEAQYVGESINGEFLYTGARYQQLESDVLSKFEDLSSKTSQTTCNQAIKNGVLRKFNYLSAEQKSAVIGLTDNSNFGILVGKAGAGKTTAMQAISEIYEKSGSRVIGMSLSAVASENLGKDAGIESATIASWAHRWRVYEAAQEKFLSFNSIVTDGVLKQLDWYNDLKRYEGSQLKSGDVIVIDEAGMVGTKDWKVVLDAAEQFGAKVIAVGDDNQFKPISSGDCFRKFLDVSSPDDCRPNDRTQVVVSSFKLEEIRRQKEDWQREASVEFSKLNAGEALAKYEHHERIHEIEGLGIYSEIAEKYLEIEKLGTSAVLCSTRSDCVLVNDEIRSLKKERGELGDDFIRINGRSFAENDRVIFLQNNRRFDVKNGNIGSVKSFEKGILTVQTESGIRSVDTREYDKIDHAYAITLHKSQGKTYDNTIVLANKMMDAKAFYVGMTRHRDNVDLYYKKTDFGSFKDLTNSASKYSHKDSLEDYRNIENKNKALVFEYKEALLETASVLIDINRGEADWKEYHALKSNNIALGKEILGNYDSHKLYLDQLGITKEKLEIGVGLKQRPLSNVELNAKNIVDLYAKSSQETRSMFSEMKKESFNVTKHDNYDKYCCVRELRNDLAKEILSNYPLHREFVRETSREFFISKKSMENQVVYAERVGAGKASERNGTSSHVSASFLEKLNEHPKEIVKNIFYVSQSEIIETAKREDGVYRLNVQIYKEDYGFGLHISNNMMREYIRYNKLDMNFKPRMAEYASMMAEKHLQDTKSNVLSTDVAESCIKQSVCFEALKQARGIERLSKDEIDVLHQKSYELAKHISESNIHALNNKELMMEASAAIHGSSSPIKSLESKEVDRLVEISKEELRNQQLSQQLEKQQEICLER